MGFGLDVRGSEQARRCKRRAHSPGAAKRTGRSTAGPAGESSANTRSDPKRFQRFGDRRREESFAGRPDRSRGCAAIEKAAKAAGHDVKVAFTPGRMTPHKSRRMSNPSSRLSEGGRFSAIFQRRTALSVRKNCCGRPRTVAETNCTGR